MSNLCIPQKYYFYACSILSYNFYLKYYYFFISFVLHQSYRIILYLNKYCFYVSLIILRYFKSQKLIYFYASPITLRYFISKKINFYIPPIMLDYTLKKYCFQASSVKLDYFIPLKSDFNSSYIMKHYFIPKNILLLYLKNSDTLIQNSKNITFIPRQ